MLERQAVMGKRPARTTLVLCSALCLLTLQTSAQVPAARKVAAEALFDRGKARLLERKYAEAANLFEQSEALDAGIGTRMYLAFSYEQLGRLASAWALYREASSAAAEKGEVERAQKSKAHAALLEPRLPHLILQVAPADRVPGLTIQLNGLELPESAWGVPMPVDPGDNQIAMQAPGYQAYSVVRRMTEGGTPVGLSLPALQPIPPSWSEQVGQAAAADTSRASKEAPAPPPEAPANLRAQRGPGVLYQDAKAGWQRPAAVVAGGLGVVALGAGTFFGLRAMSRDESADMRCPNIRACQDPTAARYSRQANESAWFANGFLLGGALLATTGVVLWLSDPSERAAELSVLGDPQSLRLQLGGHF